MTLKKTNKHLATQALMGGGYNRNGTKLILTEVRREHSQAALDILVGALELKSIFGFKPGTEFKR